METIVRRAIRDDREHWLRMRTALLPDEGTAHPAETAAYFDEPRQRYVTLIAERPGAGPVGFVEVGERSYAEGCETSPVAFVEAWYVDEDFRRQGVGRALFAAAEAWARDHGHTEIASDVVLGNEDGVRAHKALGYEEVVRLVSFARKLR